MYRDGKYYFIATNDADHNHTLYMRCSPTLEGIVTAEEKLFLDSETYPDVKGLLWAPEFHTINGKLYMFHAATPSEFYWQVSRVRELKEGGDPMCKEDWSCLLYTSTVALSACAAVFVVERILALAAGQPLFS